VTALELFDLRVSLGGRPVLQGVDLTLAEGELLVIAGRNGVGKTTLLRAVTGVLAPDSGRIEVAGRPLAELDRRELARSVALVPQETTLPFPFRVIEVALMGRSPHLPLLGFESAADRRMTFEALERLGIAELAERSVLEVSGGERQLAMVARALVQEAPVLLLDEPTAHLDVRRRLTLLALLRELAVEGRAVAVVSHDLSVTAWAADRIAVLADGRVRACGPPGEALSPEVVRDAFGVEADLLHTPDGRPVWVPTRPVGDR